MSHELIERVKRAEEKADAEIEAAREKARSIEEKAELDARAGFEKRVKALEARKEKIFADAERDGARKAEALLKEGAAERKALEVKWKRNAPKAAAFVKEFVLTH